MKLFDRNKLEIMPLSERNHDLTYETIIDLAPYQIKHEAFAHVSKAVHKARSNNALVI